jgi:hypothetical protein
LIAGKLGGGEWVRGYIRGDERVLSELAECFTIYSAFCRLPENEEPLTYGQAMQLVNDTLGALYGKKKLPAKKKT